MSDQYEIAMNAVEQIRNDWACNGNDPMVMETLDGMLHSLEMLSYSNPIYIDIDLSDPAYKNVVAMYQR